jgi:hypothetical protein
MSCFVFTILLLSEEQASDMFITSCIGADAHQEQPTTAESIEQRVATALAAQDGVHALEAANACVA